MPGRSPHPYDQEPPVVATYLILLATLIVILLPTLLNAWLGHVPVLKLVP
jgi:hypothetical protein